MNRTVVRISLPDRERGVVLLVALIVLVAMSLAAVGLMRSVDTTSGIAGNLAFRESAIASSDAAIEASIAFLEANRSSGVLNNNVPAQAYFAAADMTMTGSTSASNDWSRYDWKGKARALPADAAGNTVEYIIERLCSGPGTFGPSNACASKEVSIGDAANSKSAGSETPFTASYLSFRVTARVTDPKGATTYIQVMAY